MFEFLGLLDTSIAICVFGIFFLGAAVWAGFLGNLWVWVCALLGAVYLMSGSAALAENVPVLIDIFHRILDFMVPEHAGPLTQYLHSAFPAIEELISSYASQTAEYLFSFDLTADASAVVIMFLECAFVPELTGIWLNTELIAVLFVINMIYRFIRRRGKSHRFFGRNRRSESGATL